MKQEDKDRQIAMRNSRGYKLASLIVDLMGLIAEGTITNDDSVEIAIEKLKGEIEKDRTRL